MKRNSGVLLPVFALPGEYGCGGFGKSAYEWIDKLHDGGFTYWQVLPFGVTDAHGSPYMSVSSFAGNPYFVDLCTLYEKGLLTEAELREERVADPYLCDYERLSKTRYQTLKKAALRIKDRGPVCDFAKKNPDTDAACRFLAEKTCAGNEDDLFAWRFIQYEFHKQWDMLHDYAKSKGVKIIGDIPFYVSPDGCDVYSAPNAFMLDSEGKPTEVAGVPPDYFSENGQLWGNPIYNWEAMEKDGYAWWRRRVGYSLRLFDGVRIDHFRAISAYWSIPGGAKSAMDGKWVEGPGKKLIDAFAPLLEDKIIFAENLGIIDTGVDELLNYSSYPGMAVFQFGFDGNPASPHLPHNYKENLICYTGTHDNNTLLGFLFELDEDTRAAVSDYLGNPPDLFAAVVRSLFMSAAATVILPVQDLLGYGADTRINTPGTAEGNWRYRITVDQLNKVDFAHFRHLNEIYNRI